MRDINKIKNQCIHLTEELKTEFADTISYYIQCIENEESDKML
jgi:hypothetical protein